jgi:hypothetical protein
MQSRNFIESAGQKKKKDPVMGLVTNFLPLLKLTLLDETI